MKRKIELFSAGCPSCEEALEAVQGILCPNCALEVLDMRDPKVAARARKLGVRRVPAVAVNGVLADCCKQGGVETTTLRALGVGQP